jgi:hypothetical protein
MATIEKRVRNGKTTYRVRYRDPGGGQRSKVFARKADAQRFLNETETAKARGTWTDPSLGKVLFRDWLGEWWATTTNLRPKTRDRDELLLRRLALPSFGAVPLGHGDEHQDLTRTQRNGAGSWPAPLPDRSGVRQTFWQGFRGEP